MRRGFILFIVFFATFFSSLGQTLLGYQVADYLRSATNPYGCDPGPLIGPPDDSMWVNFHHGETIIGLFGANCTDGPGPDLLLESSFNIYGYAYNIRLLLNNNQYTAPIQTSQAYGTWTITNHMGQNWSYLWQSQCYSTQMSYNIAYYLMDFGSDFGLDVTDTVKGIEVTFLYDNPDIAGIYIVKGCTKPDLGPNKIFCESLGLETLSVDIADAQFLWQDNSTDSTFMISQPGLYWVQVSTECGIVSDTILVSQVNLPPLDLGKDTILCGGGSIEYNFDFPGFSFLWNDGSQMSQYVIYDSGEYSLALSKEGCTVSDTINVKLIELDIGRDTSYCSSNPFTIKPNLQSASYLWQDKSTYNYFVPYSSGFITLQTSKDNCILKDSIYVNLIDCEVNLEMPNVFTPNNDGVNDIFIPVKVKRISEINLRVFDRWGKYIFSSTALYQGWDGTRNGTLCSEGTYYYTLEYFTENRELKSFTGSVQLIR